MYTQYHCDGLSEEVKQVVISVQDYHVRREIYPMSMHMVGREQAADLVERAEVYAKRELLEGLEQLVKVDANLERNFIEAVIWMPYVKDAIVKQLEEHNKILERENGRLANELGMADRKIEELLLPWWKKLWLIIIGH